MKILVDSDWVLELFVNREQYRTEAEKLLDLLEKRSQVEVYATELCLDKIKSFLGHNDPQLGYDAVSWVRQKFNNRLLPFNLDIRDSASNLAIKDFESAVEVAIAQKENMGAIITLNTEIFAGANLPVLSANNLIERLALEKTWSNHISPNLVNVDLQTIERLNRLLHVEFPSIGILIKCSYRSLDQSCFCTMENNVPYYIDSTKCLYEIISTVKNISKRNKYKCSLEKENSKRIIIKINKLVEQENSNEAVKFFKNSSLIFDSISKSVFPNTINNRLNGDSTYYI